MQVREPAVWLSERKAFRKDMFSLLVARCATERQSPVGDLPDMEVDQEHAAAGHIVQQPVARPLRAIPCQRLDRHLQQDITALSAFSRASTELCCSAWLQTSDVD